MMLTELFNERVELEGGGVIDVLIGKLEQDTADSDKSAPSPKQSRKKSARKPAKGGTMRRKKGS